MEKSEQKVIIYTTADGKSSVALMQKDGAVWVNQTQMAELFGTSKQNASRHILNVLADKELDANSVVKNYLTTAADGKSYDVAFYSLEMILAVGFRVRGKRGIQFRQWANEHLKEFIVKGFVIDDHRMKNPDGRPDYFDELLERIRDIRASEKRFYQKVRELFALSVDYDASDKATQMFFAETQNKLLFAVTGLTAAELIVKRADANQPNMGLTSWQGSIVRKQDIYTAKNYLSSDELDSLNRLVVVFLESAELRAKSKQHINMDFWRESVDRLIAFSDKALLVGKGTVSNSEMEAKVKEVYNEFDASRKQFEALQADEQDLLELKKLEEEISKRKKK